MLVYAAGGERAGRSAPNPPVPSVESARAALGAEWLELTEDLFGPAETLRGVSHDYHLCHAHDAFYYQRRSPDDLSPEQVTAIERLVAERTQARQDKNWGRADEIRGELDALGVQVTDTASGPTWQLR